MESSQPVSNQDELGKKSDPEEPRNTENLASLAKRGIGSETADDAPRPLALIPLISAAFSKSNKFLQNKSLEAKQFPLVLGRSNLSQWWYQSCDCQQYYCRLHCRPVAQNIGSLSKMMIQIDTKGTAHLVGKNPHLVTIIKAERGNDNGGNSYSDDKDKRNDIKDDVNQTEKTEDVIKMNKPENKDGHQSPIVLRAGDILSIGRRDREPWMRFQVVEAGAIVNGASSAKKSPNDSPVKIKNSKITDGNAVIEKKPGFMTASKQTQSAHNLNHPKTKTQQDVIMNSSSSVQQKNTHHDAQLPEWITTTTTTNTAPGKRSRMSSSSYHDFGTKDTKQQQQHRAMVATLTKAAAAAGAAADADERNKSKKHYRYNSYYNYYNQSNFEADPSATQRKRRRHTTSSFAHYHHGLSSHHHNKKSLIRSADDLYYNGVLSRGCYHNDPQIHLVSQDYERSAQLIQAGTREGRKRMRMAKESEEGGIYNTISEKANISNTNKIDETQKPTTSQRKHARTDRNFIGRRNNKRANNNEACDGNGTQPRQSDSMGMLSKNYAAALLGANAPSVAASAEVNETATKNVSTPALLPGE
mmetsp:Transcript_18570/g.42914  ORF Transcript_18570/g.42914 Transcript_18570/m.42914 type:complete len:585 (+) Transcript_18570:264-2018(+)